MTRLGTGRLDEPVGRSSESPIKHSATASPAKSPICSTAIASTPPDTSRLTLRSRELVRRTVRKEFTRTGWGGGWCRVGVGVSRRGRLRLLGQTEDPFADDVALDLARAAPDRL